MGLSSSSANFLFLTARKDNIGRELNHLSLVKMSLTRSANEVTRKYSDALSSKCLKWSNNSGVTYQDLSYSLLMRPNASNNNKPVLITNNSGKIVVDEKYEKYAQMISADGSSGGTWDGDTRAQIISALTGISVDKINSSVSLADKMNSAAIAEDKAYEDYVNWIDKEASLNLVTYLTADDFMNNIGKIGGKDYSNDHTGTYSVSGGSGVKSLTDGIFNNMKQYFMQDDNVKDRDAFEKACNNAYNHFSEMINASGDKANSERAENGITGSTGNWKIDVSRVFNYIMSAYKNNTGSTLQDEKTGETLYACRNTSDQKWQDWHKTLKEKETAYKTAMDNYDISLDDSNQVFTSAEEREIAFYDLLFTAIAENGWTYDGGVSDNEYLNQMFQNNQYYVVTMSENECYDEDATCGCGSYMFDYEMDSAANFNNIFIVNDSDAASEAQSEYEYEKSLIKEKETRIDTRMKNLETEQSSIVKMLESINKVMNDNIETHMSVFT